MPARSACMSSVRTGGRWRRGMLSRRPGSPTRWSAGCGSATPRGGAGPAFPPPSESPSPLLQLWKSSASDSCQGHISVCVGARASVSVVWGTPIRAISQRQPRVASSSAGITAQGGKNGNQGGGRCGSRGLGTGGEGSLPGGRRMDGRAAWEDGSKEGARPFLGEGQGPPPLYATVSAGGGPG